MGIAVLDRMGESLEEGLVAGLRGSWAGHVGVEIDTPEMGRGGEEFHANTDTAIASSAQVDDPAFLFFLSFRVHQDEHFAIIDLVAEVQEPAMSADDQGFANFAKLAAFMAASLCLQAHFAKDALATTLRALSEVNHGLMMGWERKGVNCPFGQVC